MSPFTGDLTCAGWIDWWCAAATCCSAALDVREAVPGLLLALRDERRDAHGAVGRFSGPAIDLFAAQGYGAEAMPALHSAMAAGARAVRQPPSPSTTMRRRCRTGWCRCCAPRWAHHRPNDAMIACCGDRQPVSPRSVSVRVIGRRSPRSAAAAAS